MKNYVMALIGFVLSGLVLFSNTYAAESKPGKPGKPKIVSYLEIVVLDPVITISSDMRGTRLDKGQLKTARFLIKASGEYTVVIDEEGLSNGVLKVDGSDFSHVRFLNRQSGQAFGGSIFLDPNPKGQGGLIWWNGSTLNPKLIARGPMGTKMWGLGGKLNTDGNKIIPAGTYSLTVTVNAFLNP